MLKSCLYLSPAVQQTLFWKTRRRDWRERGRHSSTGHKLGHFDIVELIGRGGMGDVYRARDTRLKCDVAIKVLPAEFASAVLTRLTTNPGLTTHGAISSDGKLVAFASDRAGTDNLDIWVKQIGAGGSPVRLTPDPADDDDPTFTPDGTRIAFRSERNGGGIYEIPALGGDARLLGSQGRRPRFSPMENS